MVSVPKINGVAKNCKTYLKDSSKRVGRYKDYAKAGWKQGAAEAKRNEYGQVKTCATKIKGAWKHTKIDPNDYPAVGLGVGTLVPLPLAGPIGLGIGFVLKLLKRISK